ncbi:chemotaxis protein CheX [Desulfobaculum bizertense]|uniref:Chemotaxis protein CheX n=1 Tax=Desulfobaculum bizertense DSM 18034 TaxID=1121442 RepID=A0A1T4WGS1_9BACT|nr:chemotaxis protein CheX [Desulfobaculum bizertense]UIJ39396.1 chemotaxis protein CheX [Desulfobaculum bizertense]SKA76492.1 chemotaxis protein CheX [Desulfobaculum bizertense DSM 18034]
MNVKEDVRIVKPFLNAVQSVLSMMAMVEATPGKPYIKKDSQAVGDVTGIISLSGDRNGTISVTFSEACILRVVSGMLGEEITEMGAEIRDAVGELTNMISGQARQGLSALGTKFDGGIPSVIMGKNHTISHICKEPILAIPFSTACGAFTVEVSLE